MVRTFFDIVLDADVIVLGADVTVLNADVTVLNAGVFGSGPYAPSARLASPPRIPRR